MAKMLVFRGDLRATEFQTLLHAVDMPANVCLKEISMLQSKRNQALPCSESITLDGADGSSRGYRVKS